MSDQKGPVQLTVRIPHGLHAILITEQAAINKDRMAPPMSLSDIVTCLLSHFIDQVEELEECADTEAEVNAKVRRWLREGVR
jgi:hypothetical protein